MYATKLEYSHHLVYNLLLRIKGNISSPKNITYRVMGIMDTMNIYNSYSYMDI